MSDLARRVNKPVVCRHAPCTVPTHTCQPHPLTPRQSHPAKVANTSANACLVLRLTHASASHNAPPSEIKRERQTRGKVCERRR